MTARVPLLILFSGLCAWLPLCNVNAETIEFKGATFVVHRIDPAQEKLQVFWRDEDGKKYGTFGKLEAALKAKGKRLKFATNAGIYAVGFVPEGLHIEDGKELVPVNTKDAYGNFYLKPNGIFFINDNGPGILETGSYLKNPPKPEPRLAVQSGPLLLHGGKIHPAFNEPSTSRLLRNGVGVTRDGKTIVFACSVRTGEGHINLHGFASLFKHLGCNDALFLDGDISEVFIRGETAETPQQTSDFAAILAVVEEAP